MKLTIRRVFPIAIRYSQIKCFLLGFALLAPVARVPGGGLVFPDALVAHWAFDESTGSIIHDSSTNHLGGTLVGGTWTTGAALYDGAVEFNGLSEAVFIPAPGQPAPNPVATLAYGAIVVRFHYHATGSGGYVPILQMGPRSADSVDQSSLVLEIGHANDPANRKLYFTIIASGFCFDTGINLAPDTWYQYVCVVSSNGNTGYLNGQELTGRHYNLGSTPAYTNFFSSVACRDSLSLAYGYFGWGPVYAPVTLSDVQIYNRPLTAAEVRLLYLDVNDTNGLQLRTLGPSEDQTGMVLSWPSDANYTYSIFHSETMPFNWQPVPGFTNLPATPPINYSTVPFGSAASGWFRVQATAVP